jgi:hypothetical protein
VRRLAPEKKAAARRWLTEAEETVASDKAVGTLDILYHGDSAM